MKHARKDYDRIQDPEHKIPEDEPVFVLRAQDICAPPTVMVWAYMAELAGADPNIVLAAHNQVANMITWQQRHGRKIPDMPEEA